MYFCYLDESGTPELAGQTSHFVLIGLAIPAAAWHRKDQRINVIKKRYALQDVEIHTGYLARRFPEQEHIQRFGELDSIGRRAAVKVEREKSLIKAAALNSQARLKSLKKVYSKSADYVHLMHKERIQPLRDLADKIGSLSDARLFAEAVDKATAPPGRTFLRRLSSNLSQDSTPFSASARPPELIAGGLLPPDRSTITDC